MLTMGLCYCLILGAIGLVIVWSPLSRPDAANSQAPLLMQLEQVKPQVHLDMAKHVTPNPLVHVHVATDHNELIPTQQQTSVSQSNTSTVPMTYNGRPLRALKTIKMKVTAYSPDERSCGKWADGITASGYSVWTNAGKLVAADTHLLPYGTLLTVPGYNGSKPVPVLDIGGKIKGNRLDVLYPTHAIARRWGVQELAVTVWEYAD
tara:strand:- start:1212 stop:1829 length:618 start_codon:yes stop_codon:yes gene_type:complete